ncbi:hypothetical protein [Kitasatospora sp. NPDC059673]|uniref:hypothetical protein n=1 Tax=Kitasatospora sp. NPDC059673 TaxID=3346901 RepID=UPI00369B53DE
MAIHGKRTAVAAALTAVLGAGMSACGPDRDSEAAAPAGPVSAPASASASASASDVTVLLPESRTVGAKVRSVRIAFRLDLNGKLLSGEAFGDKDGTCVGWAQTDGDGRTDFVRKAGTVWVTPKDGATQQTLKLPADNPTAKKMTGYCDTGLEILATGGLNTMGADAINRPAGQKDVGGVKAQVFKDLTGSELVIAAEGPAYLLSMSASTPARIEMQFSDFDRPVQVVVPPAAQVVDGTQYLGGGAGH